MLPTSAHVYPPPSQQRQRNSCERLFWWIWNCSWIDCSRLEQIVLTGTKHHSNMSCDDLLLQRWVSAMSQQEALLQLQAWLEAASGRVRGRGGRLKPRPSSGAAVAQLLRDLRVGPHRTSPVPGTSQLLPAVWFMLVLMLILVPGVSDGDGGSPSHAGLRQPGPPDLQYRGGPGEALRAQPVGGAAGPREPRVAQLPGSPQLPGRNPCFLLLNVVLVLLAVLRYELLLVLLLSATQHTHLIGFTSSRVSVFFHDSNRWNFIDLKLGIYTVASFRNINVV